MNDSLYPSIIVAASDHDYQRRKGGGGGTPQELRPFVEAQHEMLEQCTTIREGIDRQQPSPMQFGLARLTMRTDASARSNRPSDIFNERTCPMVSEGDTDGQFLVLVTPERLDRLTERVKKTRGKAPRVHLTGVASFELLRAEQRLPPPVSERIRLLLAQEGVVMLRVYLPRFTLFTPVLQHDLEQQLRAIEGISDVPYLIEGDFFVYAARLESVEQALSLAEYPFIERIDVMPRYSPVRIHMSQQGSTPVIVGIPPSNAPIVAIFDGGIDANGPLGSLVWGRESYIAEEEYDFEHGTQIAALVAAQGALTSSRLEPFCRLLDLRALGQNGTTHEHILVQRLDDAVVNFAQDVKLWNLSFASEPGQQPEAFSSMGKHLDALSQHYGILFFVAAGNCTNWRTSWPVVQTEDLHDWISSPGDTLCNITVGAVAPEQTLSGAYAPPGAPAPFTPHGPGPQSLIKPDIVAPGGNASPIGAIGIATLGANGCLVAAVGTSMATPQVTGIAAELLACIERTQIAPSHTPLVMKAMLLHHAVAPESFALGNSPSDFYGFGRLNQLSAMLGDPFWQSTTLLTATLFQDQEDLILDSFPLPDGLRGLPGRTCSLWVTLVTEPLLDGSQVRDYACSDVEVMLGLVDPDGRLMNLLRPQHLRSNYEKSLDPQKQKWSPIKQYQVKVPRPGLGSQPWRMSASLHTRRVSTTGVAKTRSGVPLVLAYTIVDHTKQIPVNSQMVQRWRAQGYIPQQVAVTPRIQAQFTARMAK